MANKLNISVDSLRKYEANARRPSYEKLIEISTILNVSLELLLKVNLRKADLKKLMLVADNRVLFPVLVDKDNNDVIEVISTKSVAGYLKGHTDPEYFENLQTMKLPFKIVGKHRAFPIIGDSMPPNKEGSFVIGKFVESFESIHSGDTYIVLTDDGPVYKRVYRKSNSLELYSDNPIYKPYEVAREKVYEIWQFVCCINLTNKKDNTTMDAILDEIKLIRNEFLLSSKVSK